MGKLKNYKYTTNAKTSVPRSKNTPISVKQRRVYSWNRMNFHPPPRSNLYYPVFRLDLNHLTETETDLLLRARQKTRWTNEWAKEQFGSRDATKLFERDQKLCSFMIAVNGSRPFSGSYDRPINLPTDRQASREVVFPIKKYICWKCYLIMEDLPYSWCNSPLAD